MLQIAILVDAGYLFAQGSALLAGAKVPRTQTRLNAPVVLSELSSLAKTIEPNARLLRIYWYDGLYRGSTESFDQRAIAESENVKCRFGTINSHGEQKGVDSLIVTDMIELARGQAISDALVVSGDEDIRVGVQVAQSFGIRVHLLGIQPSRGSQSPDLRAESDTLHEWSDTQVSSWLEIIKRGPKTEAAPTHEAWMETAVQDALQPLSPEEAKKLVEFSDLNRNQLPQDFDRPALGRAGDRAGRKLDSEERKLFRIRLREGLRDHAMRPNQD